MKIKLLLFLFTIIILPVSVMCQQEFDLQANLLNLCNSNKVKKQIKVQKISSNSLVLGTTAMYAFLRSKQGGSFSQKFCVMGGVCFGLSLNYALSFKGSQDDLGSNESIQESAYGDQGKDYQFDKDLIHAFKQVDKISVIDKRIINVSNSDIDIYNKLKEKALLNLRLFFFRNVDFALYENFSVNSVFCANNKTTLQEAAAVYAWAMIRRCKQKRIFIVKDLFQDQYKKEIPYNSSLGQLFTESIKIPELEIKQQVIEFINSEKIKGFVFCDNNQNENKIRLYGNSNRINCLFGINMQELATDYLDEKHKWEEEKNKKEEQYQSDSLILYCKELYGYQENINGGLYEYPQVRQEKIMKTVTQYLENFNYFLKHIDSVHLCYKERINDFLNLDSLFLTEYIIENNQYIKNTFKEDIKIMEGVKETFKKLLNKQLEYQECYILSINKSTQENITNLNNLKKQLSDYYEEICLEYKKDFDQYKRYFIKYKNRCFSVEREEILAVLKKILNDIGVKIRKTYVNKIVETFELSQKTYVNKIVETVELPRKNEEEYFILSESYSIFIRNRVE